MTEKERCQKQVTGVMEGCAVRTQHIAAEFEDEGRRTQAKKCGWPLASEKARKLILPWSFQKGIKPSQHLDITPVKLVSDF